MLPALLLKPQLFTSAYTSCTSASAIARTSGYRSKSAGVTLFTCLSVHCADKIVATSVS